MNDLPDTSAEDYEPAGPDQSAKRARGRPRNEHYLPFEQAREFMRQEMIPSRGKFYEWWERNKPKAIPRFPYRVYKEWVSWNDFLGTNNKFNDRGSVKWRSLNEAAQWVHTLQLKSYSEWIEYCRETELPEDIPARPELVYDNWRSWNHWLGNKPAEALQVKQEAARNRIFYIIHEQDAPGNVLTFGIESGGSSALKAWWERDKFEIVKLFWYNQDEAEAVQRIVNVLSTPYMGLNKQRIVPNVWEIVWHLQMRLEMITKFTETDQRASPNPDWLA